MSQTEPSGTSAQPRVLPEHIRQNLKKYRQHAERIPCLECGYVGPMGGQGAHQALVRHMVGKHPVGRDCSKHCILSVRRHRDDGRCHRGRLGKRYGAFGWQGYSFLPQLRSRPAAAMRGARERYSTN